MHHMFQIHQGKHSSTIEILILVQNHPSNVSKMDIARTYGSKFFKENFGKLVDVKTRVDPEIFFRYEQSIPPTSKGRNLKK